MERRASIRLFIIESIEGEGAAVKALVSIHPRFARLILSGREEMRVQEKAADKTDIGRIVIYATSPVSRIIGEAGVESMPFFGKRGSSGGRRLRSEGFPNSSSRVISTAWRWPARCCYPIRLRMTIHFQ